MTLSVHSGIIRSLFTYFFDTLFPPSAETLLVRRLTRTDVTRLYEPRVIAGITALAPFTSPVLRALIHETKFKGNARGAELLAYLLYTHITAHDTLRSSTYIPIPLSPKRKRERGYNQVTQILTALTRQIPEVHIDESLLTRSRHTRPQTELSQKERRANMDNAFLCLHPNAIRGNHIVIIDDVSTTGTTLRAAENALLPHHPASITLIALAH